MYFEKESQEPNFLGLESTKTEGEDGEFGKLNIAQSNTFYKPSWFSVVENEFVAARDAVAICDYTSFAKMDIWSGGMEVVDYLQRVCSNNIDVPIGK